MMNPAGAQVKHIGRSWGQTTVARGSLAMTVGAAQEPCWLVTMLSTSQSLPTFSMVTVAWFL
jgi:hypothetical protein